MLKKMMMLAFAVGALAAMPSVAMGAWTDETVNVQANASIGFTGNAKFQGQLGSINCQTQSTTTLEPGTTGKVNTFEVDQNTTATSCTTGGFLAFCQVHSVQATGLPWTAHTDGATIDITVGEIHNTLTGGFCPVTTLTITGGTAQITPNNLHAAQSGTLGGEVTVDANGESSLSEVSGTQTVLGAASGTYGIT